MSEAGWQGGTIDASTKARWSVKRLRLRRGTSLEGQGGNVVLLFLGRSTPEEAEAEAKGKLAQIVRK